MAKGIKKQHRKHRSVSLAQRISGQLYGAIGEIRRGECGAARETMGHVAKMMLTDMRQLSTKKRSAQMTRIMRVQKMLDAKCSR